MDANYSSTTVSFEYGLTISYGSVNVSGVLLGHADSFKKVTITGLTPHKTYHFRVRAINAVDTSYGADMTFITGGASSSYSGKGEHMLMVDSNGLVYATGYNGQGQLGDGTTTVRDFPVRVLKGAYPGTTYLGDNPSNPIIAVAVGYFHSLALAADGTIYSFGQNANGQLGRGNTSNSALPVLATGISGAIAIAAGQYFSFGALE